MASTVREDEARYCPKCSEVQQPNTQFCPWCGALLDGTQAALPPQRPTAPAPVARSQRAGIAVLVVVVVFVAFIALAVYFTGRSQSKGLSNLATVLAPASAPAVAPAVRLSTSITYSVSGTNGVTRASLTYQNDQGGTEQVETALPWSKSFSVKSGQFVYILAQNASNVAGGIACDITADSKSFKHSESNGVAVIAQCNGSAP